MHLTIQRTIRLAIAIAGIGIVSFAQKTPSVDDAKRAVETTLQEIWKRGGTNGKRTVLFQEVRAGRASSEGKYPFQATLTVHDQDAGYPPNGYFGRTCVGRFEREVYYLVPDEFGSWIVQGRMTPDSAASTCQNNPSAGVSAIPVASLQGSAAPAGVAASSTAAVASDGKAPQNPQAASSLAPP